MPVLVYLTRSSIAARLHRLISEECNGKVWKEVFRA